MSKHLPTILVTGADGQVGSALIKELPKLGQIVASTFGEVKLPVPNIRANLMFEHEIRSLVREAKPDVIVNAAAYTAVDRAESEPEAAFAINEAAVRILSQEAKARKIPLIHYSTDYVFDGSGSEAWREDAPTGPLNIYGLSKLAGENALLAAAGSGLLFRTSWVFSDHGNNFVKAMLRLGRERDEIRVVSDQIGAPTDANMIARMTALALERGFSEGFEQISGMYHLCSAGETSWHALAQEIFSCARQLGQGFRVQNVIPIRTDDYPSPARRPLNSRLDCRRFIRRFDIKEIPTWQESLRETLEILLK